MVFFSFHWNSFDLFYCYSLCGLHCGLHCGLYCGLHSNFSKSLFAFRCIKSLDTSNSFNSNLWILVTAGSLLPVLVTIRWCYLVKSPHLQTFLHVNCLFYTCCSTLYYKNYQIGSTNTMLTVFKIQCLWVIFVAKPYEVRTHADGKPRVSYK